MISFAPTVNVVDENGEEHTYTPEGWMWVLAFAIKDVPWAVEEAMKPEFDARVKDWLARRRIEELGEIKEEHQKEIAEIEQMIETLKVKLLPQP